MRRRTRFFTAVGALAVAGSVASTTLASSHREAPLVSGDPQIDSTDLYAFVSPDAPDSITVISNWIPLQEPAGGPTFYPFAQDAQYDVNLDNNGDAKADLVYRWTFTSRYKNPDTFLYNTGPINDLGDPTLNFTQTYNLDRIAGTQSQRLLTDAVVAPSYVGAASMPNYAGLRDEAIIDLPDGRGKSFAGQADDPFFLDLRVFDLLYGANLSQVGRDTLDGYNVNSLALQLPKSELASGGNADANPIVGIWTTASRPGMRVLGTDGSVRHSGDMVQVSRLGNPLVNEVVVPVPKKDLFNASKPEADAQFLPKVQDPEVPKLIEKIYNLPAPAVPRNDLVSVFLTGVDGLNKPANVTPSEQLRLNMSIPPSASPNRLGVIGSDTAGFPNGRRLADDVVDIALQVVEGELLGNNNDLGDGVNTNDVSFGASFPYLALPHSGSGEEVASRGSGLPVGGVGAGAGGTHGFPTADFPMLPLALAFAGITLAAGGTVLTRRHQHRPS